VSESTRRATRLGDDDTEYALVFSSARGVRLAIHRVPQSGELLIGREPPAHAVIHDDSVSRKHARVVG